MGAGCRRRGGRRGSRREGGRRVGGGEAFRCRESGRCVVPWWRWTDCDGDKWTFPTVHSFGSIASNRHSERSRGISLRFVLCVIQRKRRLHFVPGDSSAA